VQQIKFDKNGQWTLVKAFHRSPEHTDKYQFSRDFKYATQNTPITQGGKLEIDHHQFTNKIKSEKDGNTLYHHVYKNGLGDTRHILSLHQDPSKPGVAATSIQTDPFTTGFKDGRPVDGGVMVHGKENMGKGYGKALLQAAIDHHGEWHSGESITPDGDALLNSIIKTGKYDVTPDTHNSEEEVNRAMNEGRKGDISRIVLRVKKPTQ
jgi:hypothetical protein